MPNPDFPLLEIVAISDKTTLVVAGPGVEQLVQDDELYVVGVGEGKIPKTNAPYVVPKARVEVTFPAGVYAIVRSPEQDVEVNTSSLFILQQVTGSRTVRKRVPMPVDETAMIGAPREPIKVGDPVVRVGDLARYVQYLATETHE